MTFHLAAFLVILTLCQFSTAEASSVIPNLDGMKQYELGHGFDSATQSFRKPCLTGTKVYGNAESELQFERSLTQEEIDSLVQAEFEGGINLVIASGSIKTKVSSVIRKDAYSERLVYRAKIRKNSVALREPIPTALGLTLIAQADHQLTRENCGDEYVQSVVRGADLFITLTFRFSEEAMRSEFVTKAKIKVMGISKTKTFRKVTEDLDRSTLVDIDAVQIGGDPKALDGVLAEIGQRSCQLYAIEECNRIVDRIIEYASNPDEFPKQVEDMESVLSYRTTRYFGSTQEALYPVSTPILQDVAKAAAEELSTSILDAENIAAEIDSILKRPLKNTERSLLLHLQKVVIPTNLSLLRKAALTCFRSPLRCTKAKDDALASQIPVDKAALQITRTFFHYCEEFKADNNTNPGLNFVLRIAGTDECLLAEEQLKSKDTLDLKNFGLIHAYFLRGLGQLRTLDLRGNGLISAGFSAAVPQLESLDLSNNHIDDLLAIHALKELKVLKIQNNAISSISALEHLKNLNVLIAYNNSFVNLSSLQNLNLTRRIITQDEACHDQRTWALSSNLVSSEENALYSEIGFVPLNDAGEISWIACFASMRLLYHNFEKL